MKWKELGKEWVCAWGEEEQAKGIVCVWGKASDEGEEWGGGQNDEKRGREKKWVAY